MSNSSSAGSSSFIVIPARLESTRLPRKLLLRETGRTLLEHTYLAASQARLPSGICVAVDHPLLADEVRRFGGRVQMTDPRAASGTDRVAEVAAGLDGIEIIVNVQGDEPELSGDAIDLAVQLLVDDPQAVMSTLATPIRARRQLDDPSCVKVVMDDLGRALYFSRSPIPFARPWSDRLLTAEPACFYQHIGLYAYRRTFLRQLATLPRSGLEALESLEQLRVLSAGYALRVGLVEHAAAGIDTPEDYQAFVERLRGR